MRHFFHLVLDAYFPPPVKLETKFFGSIEPLLGFHSVNGVPVEWADFTKRSAKPEHVPEYDTLSIESEENYCRFRYPWTLRIGFEKKGEQTGKNMQGIAAEILEEVYQGERN